MIGVRLLAKNRNVAWIVHSAGDFDTQANIHGPNGVIKIEAIYPKSPPVTAPESIPDTAKRAFIQAEENKKKGHSDAASSMYRKAMDIATRALDASLSGKNLATRIDALHNAGKLTQDLKEWAHLIRLDGNQGAHDDDELTDTEIAQLASFTELFLIYTFTLPAQVQARKEAAARDNAAVNQ